MVPGATNSELGARFVVLAVEVGGGWSPETQSFSSQLASAKVCAESPLMDAQTRGTSMAISVGRPVVMLSCSGCCNVPVGVAGGSRCGWHLSAST